MSNRRLQTRNRMLQALRGAACLLVVLYHTLQAAAGERAIAAWPNGSAGVDLFFVISGYVMVTSSGALVARADGWRVFLWRRACRIVPLYWLLTLAKLAVVAAAPALVPHTLPTAWGVAGSLLFIPVRDAAGLVRPVLPVGWTLNFEMLFYLLFAAALARRVAVMWLPVPLSFLALAGFFHHADWPAPLFLANGMVLEFAAGMALAHAFARDRSAMPVLHAQILLAVGAALLLALPLAGPARFLVWGIPASMIVAATVALDRPEGAKLPRWVLKLGDGSYAIYLVHPFVVPALARHGAAGAVAAVPASVALGLVLHAGIDAPLQRWLGRQRKEGLLFCRKEAKDFCKFRSGCRLGGRRQHQ